MWSFAYFVTHVMVRICDFFTFSMIWLHDEWHDVALIMIIQLTKTSKSAAHNVWVLSFQIFTAWCYASMVYTVIMCLSVCLSIRHKLVMYRNDWTNRFGFWHGGFLPAIPHCVLRNFKECPIFRNSKIMPWQVDRVVICQQLVVVVVVVDGRVCWWHLYELWLFATSRSIVTL